MIEILDKNESGDDKYNKQAHNYVSVTSILSLFLAHPMTFIPCFTKASQIALPIPELAPVTKAFLFAQREMVGNAIIISN